MIFAFVMNSQMIFTKYISVFLCFASWEIKHETVILFPIKIFDTLMRCGFITVFMGFRPVSQTSHLAQ